MRGLPRIAGWLAGVRQDVGYALRNLRRQPGFTAVVVIVLGAVIGLHAALATLVAGVVLRPWPGVADPSTIVRLFPVSASGRAGAFSAADFDTIAAHARALSGVAAMTNAEVRVGTAADDRGARPASALVVSGRFFDLLGVGMTAGRGFTAADDRTSAPPVAVLGEAFWRARFGADPAIVGTTIRVDSMPFTVVGVVSTAFGSAEPSFGQSLYLPLSALPLLRSPAPSAGASTAATLRNVEIVGRLAPGATRAAVEAELQLLARDLTLPSDARGIVVTDTAFASHPSRAGATQPIVAAALISAGLVLIWLTACANIGNLLLARAADRVREIGIRLSIGASRGRVVRQLLTEGLVLAVAASGVGLAIAYELPPVVLHMVGGSSASFPFEIRPDMVVLAYALLIAALSVLVFALAPALHVTRTDLAAALNLREGLPRSRFALRGVLLAVQVAVSVTLLVSAGVLVRGAQRYAASFDPGFAVNDVSVVAFELPADAYDEARRRALVADLTTALGRTPPASVRSFGFATWEPTFIRRGFRVPFRRAGDPVDRMREILYVEVSPGYLATLGIPIVAGRDLMAADINRPVVVINEAMARQFWPNENPVGKTFAVGRDMREVVGVMRDAHTHSLFEVPPLFYQPMRSAQPAPKLLVRGTGPAVASDIAQLVARLDPRVRVLVTPLSAMLEERLQETRMGPTLAGIFGLFALGLSTVGMFGVFAYAVRQRTREIGIRMALGAPPRAVVRLVLAGHSVAVAVGLGAGLAGAIASTLVLRSRLHGVGPFDPIAYLSAAALLTAAGLAASYLPARRAARVDPVVALRHE